MPEQGSIQTGVLGAGLSGLTLGYLMKQKRQPFTVLEKDSKCGGLNSVVVNGFTFDVADSHIIFSKNISVLNFMTGLLGTNTVRRKRNTKVIYKDCYVKYPFENGLSDLPKQENFECLSGFIQNRLNPIQTTRNLREWCLGAFGSGNRKKYLIPYPKIWKTTPP
jgi:protoporphyrinogen oxidase